MSDLLVRGQVEIVPKLDSPSSDSLIFRDVLNVDTNKRVASGQAGNFEVKLALAHGEGYISEVTDDDVCKISLKRGDGEFTEADVVMIGQLDRVSESRDTSQVSYTLRGKDLTKQLITQTAYLQQFAPDPEKPQNSGEVLAPQDMTYVTLAETILKCPHREALFKMADGSSLPGFSVACFLKKFLTEPIFVDPDLFTGVDIDPLVDDLFLYNNSAVTLQTLNAIIEGLADRPYWFWYISELGRATFKRFQWRTVPEEIQVVDSFHWMNHVADTQDFSVVGATQITPQLLLDPTASTNFALAAHKGLLTRYGLRFLRKQEVPYLYSQEQIEERAHEQLQYQYALRKTADVTVHGTAQWFVDRFVYVEQLAAFYYVDGVNHRVKLGGEGKDKTLSWNTNLTLTLGRQKADAWLDRDKGYETIEAELGNAIKPRFLDTFDGINILFGGDPQ